ncbi:HNH endonuclease signature motif containing protein [Pseudofrankia asymbiotica]|uniref:HNH endonuclease signature motif containing protein n=1 Tax=Pseudofrankia asymbiotica TaxID=1834516 RepID=UPI001F51AE4A|nr:HNH endonuclease signature motif containing protein [Pseudofrankia asymbiotica]
MPEPPVPEEPDNWVAGIPVEPEPGIRRRPSDVNRGDPVGIARGNRAVTISRGGNIDAGSIGDGAGFDRRHHALAGLDGVVGGLKTLAGANLWALSHEEALEFLDAAERASRLLGAVMFAVVRDLGCRDLRPVFGEQDLPSTAELLRWQLKMRPVDARRTVELARDLDVTYPRTGEALTGMAISRDQAIVIVTALRALPSDTPPEQCHWAEEFLLAQAEVLDAGDLTALGRTIRARLQDQLHPPGADPRDDGDQARRRELHLTDQPDGTTRIHGTLDAAGAAALRAALEPLARPRPLGEHPEDHRTVPQLRADALIEITERVLGTGTLPITRGTRPHLTVTTTIDALLGHTGAAPATTGHGLALSHATLKRICCDANLTHILLSQEGMPLELGRTRRLVPPSLRRALVARDGGCTFPGCQKNAAWADAHHVVHWLLGGETNLDNLVLLCGFHHRVVHRGEWVVVMGLDGHPYFVPPYSVDPQRRPRRNPLHRGFGHLYSGIWEPPTRADGVRCDDRKARPPLDDCCAGEAATCPDAAGPGDSPAALFGETLFGDTFLLADTFPEDDHEDGDSPAGDASGQGSQPVNLPFPDRRRPSPE